MKSLRNPWLDHCQNYASRNNITFGEALSSEQCRKSYWKKKNLTGGNISATDEQSIIAEMCDVSEYQYTYWCKMCKNGVPADWSEMANTHPFLKNMKNRNYVCNKCLLSETDNYWTQGNCPKFSRGSASPPSTP